MTAPAITPRSSPFRVPSGYVPPPDSAWDLIRQRDMWEPDKATPDGWLPTPSEILWEPPSWETVPPLGNNVSTATPPYMEAIRRERDLGEQRRARVLAQSNRRLRFALRNEAQRLGKNANVCKCGRCRYVGFGAESGAVGVVVGARGGAHFTGLIRCGSVWECPVCTYRICAERATEIRTLVTRHRVRNGGVDMLTLTLPHDAVDALRPMRKHVAWAWSKVQAGSAYKRMRGRLKIVGSVRALEVTTGPNGWHPHLHVLVLTESPISDDDRKAYQTLVFRRWQRLITERNKKTGKAYRPPDREHGITFVPSHKDEYIAKLGLADELTRGSWKHSKDLAGYRTPLQVLRDITQARADGKIANSRDVALWTEYADEMRGARQLTWSRGLRRMYSMGDEQTDLELADKEESDPGQQIYVVSAAIWDRSFKNNWRARCQLLAAAELDGWDGVQRVIDRVSGLEPVPF